MSVRVSLCGMLRLIRIDTLRRVRNIGLLLERLIFLRAENLLTYSRMNRV